MLIILPDKLEKLLKIIKSRPKLVSKCKTPLFTLDLAVVFNDKIAYIYCIVKLCIHFFNLDIYTVDNPLH